MLYSSSFLIQRIKWGKVMRKAKGHFRRGIAALLCAGMLLQSMPVYAAGSEPSEPDMESAADAKSEEKENGADFPEAEKPKENPEDNSEKKSRR